MIMTSGLQSWNRRWSLLIEIEHELVDLPKDPKARGCRWVIRKKNEQYKARLVVKGYAQKEGINYNEISHEVKHISVRMLLVIVTQFDLELVQLDVKTTFLYRELERIFMKPLEGYFQEEQENKVFSQEVPLWT